MASVNPYITFNGNCEHAFLFYKSVFGKEFSGMTRFSELPPFDGKTIAPEDAEKILHVSLPIGGTTILMGSDATENFGGKVLAGTNYSISIDTDTTEEADSLFEKLSENAKVTMPLHQSFWGAYFGMLTDQFGINWIVNHDPSSIT